jgi:hypothetical protein
MLDTSKIPINEARFTWFIAGGWAIDLFLGRQTRHHTDLDLGIYRDDQLALQEFLSGWTLLKIVNGENVQWCRGEQLSLPVHEIHAKASSSDTVEILLAEKSESHWTYRRDPTITLPISSAVLTIQNGIRILAPEIVLLFKSKNPREQDQADFENVRPHLSVGQKQWLLDAIDQTNKTHSWMAKLAS